MATTVDWEQLELDWPASDRPGLEPLLLTVEQAAALLAVSRTTTYCLIRDGLLRTVHIYRSCRVPLAEVRAYVERLRADGEPYDGRLTRE